MLGLSVCGLNCDTCSIGIEKHCLGCRANKGLIFWGQCDLYQCCSDKKHDNCSECSGFPCDTLKEWASSEGTERIQNLIDLKNSKVNN